MPRTRNHALATLTLLASISTLALVGASQAQVPPPGGPAAAGRQGPGFQGPPAQFRAQMMKRMEERMADHKKDMATVLRLRPDQMAALDAFLAAEMPGRPDGQPPAAARDRKALTTPQRLDERAKRGQQREARMQQRAQALRTFYAALSPEQQQVFDALGRLHGQGPGAGGRMMMRMHMGPGGPDGGPRGRGGPGGFPPAPPPAR